MSDEYDNNEAFGCTRWDKTAKRVTGAEYKAARVKAAQRDVVYHEEQIRADAERVAQANAWIEVLYESLPRGAR
jgi:hypothetical protein